MSFLFKRRKNFWEKKSAEQRKIFKLSEKDAEVYFSFVFAKKTTKFCLNSNAFSTIQVDALSDLKR